MGELVIQFLAPLTLQLPSCCRRALVSMEPGSDPWFGSVRPKQPTIRPAQQKPKGERRKEARHTPSCLTSARLLSGLMGPPPRKKATRFMLEKHARGERIKSTRCELWKVFVFLFVRAKREDGVHHKRGLDTHRRPYETEGARMEKVISETTRQVLRTRNFQFEH